MTASPSSIPPASGQRLGILGGSGLYALPGLTDTAWVRVETPWGDPSDEILTGRLHGADIAFLPRHGRGPWSTRRFFRPRRSRTAVLSWDGTR